MADRHEERRAAWLEEHGPSMGPFATSCARRAQTLRARVRADEREARGLGTDHHAERPLPHAAARAQSEGRAATWLARWVIASLLLGPAIAGGYGLLRLLESRVREDAGRVPMTRLAVVGTVSAVTAVTLIVLSSPGIVGTWVIGQLCGVVPACGVWAMLWGWQGVPADAQARLADRPHDTTPQEDSQDIFGTLPPRFDDDQH